MKTLSAILLSGSILLALEIAAPAHAQEQAASPPPAAAAEPEVAPPAEAQLPASAPQPQAAPPAVAPASGRVGPPPPGKGQVVFYRPSRLGGMALSFTVREGDVGIGKLPNGTYFVLAADPGPHSYSVKSEATDTLNLEVEEGETTYVEQTIGIGIMVGRPHLTPSSQAAFDKLSLKISTAKVADAH